MGVATSAPEEAEESLSHRRHWFRFEELRRRCSKGHEGEQAKATELLARFLSSLQEATAATGTAKAGVDGDGSLSRRAVWQVRRVGVRAAVRLLSEPAVSPLSDGRAFADHGRDELRLCVRRVCD
jgi:hypothetical protein